MITHNNEIAQMASRIIRLEDGRICDQRGYSASGQKMYSENRNDGQRGILLEKRKSCAKPEGEVEFHA